MRKFAVFMLLFIPFVIEAQFVGIGTANPNAPLHVASPYGEVIRVQGANPYISIYDNTDGYRGFLWYRPALVPYIRSIDVGSANGSDLPVTISPETATAAIFLPNGNVGINTLAPSEKLDVNGSINLAGVLKINNNSGMAGQVLVSNGTSSPSWQSLAAPSNVGFCAVLSADQSVANSAATTLLPYTKLFDTQNNFNSSTGVFTAPVTGIYHFNVTTNFVSLPVATRTVIRFALDNVLFGGCQKEVFSPATPNNHAITHSVTIPVNAGQTVSYTVFHFTGSPVNVRGGGSSATASTFSGYKIY